MRKASDSDAGELWGQSLYGPMLLADPAAGVLAANQQGETASLDPRDGVYLGGLPEDLALANTAAEWDGVRWSVVLWPVSEDPELRTSVLVHEAWHRVQADLGIPAASDMASHLDDMDARISLRLELSALAGGLETGSQDVARALLARAVTYRRDRCAPDAARAASEDGLEASEGLAEYTGRKLGHRAPESAVAAALGAAAETQSFVRSFAYFTGPAYGLLLDRLAPGWRPRVVEGATLSELAAEAATGVRPAEIDPGTVEKIESSERRRAEGRAVRDRGWLQNLVSGPTLRLPIGELHTVFDPREVSALGEHGTVYPSVQLTDRWGRVEVTDSGALIDPGWQWISLSAEGMKVGATGATAGGWTLELAPGWTIEERDGGHEVVRAGGRPAPE